VPEEMAAAGGVAGESSATKTKRLRVAVIHPDLGIGTPSSPSLIVLSDPWAGCGRVPSLAEDPGTRRKLVRLGVLNFCAGRIMTPQVVVGVPVLRERSSVFRTNFYY